MTADRRFTVTIFPDAYAKSLTTREVDLGELRDMTLAPTADKKEDLPWLKLAKFGTKRTGKNSLRFNANVKCITGIEGDYDAKEMPFDRAVELLSQARLKALLYTSPSHSASAPKWRVILPTSQDLPPSEREKLVARVNGIFGGILAAESFTISQSFYYGTVNGNPDHRAVVTEGDYIDLRGADLDAGARGKKQSTPNDPAQPRPEGAKTDKQADPDLIFAALSVIPNDDAEWFERNDLGMACWNATNGHEKGFDAFNEWCRKSPTKYDAAKVRGRWEHYFNSPPTQIGAGTIFEKANEAQPGWRALRGLTIEQINEVLRLAKLAPPQYDAERKETAKRLALRVSTLDDIVGRLSSRMMMSDEDNDTDKQGTRIEFKTFEPWPDAVHGKVLMADMVKTIRSHVILSEHQALAVALWIIHTHAIEVADHTPRLQIRSPTMRCGKSTLLNVIEPMVVKPINTENITTAALFRVIQMHSPTLLIDEADSFLKRDDGRDNEEMRGILNSGHERGGTVIRTVGEDFEPRAFKVFGPVAFAWLVKRGTQVAQTLEDRSITIELRRRLPTEDITRFRSTRTNQLRELGRRAARWFADHKISLSDADPSLPEELDDRGQNKWRPLVAIADAMSPDLGQAARDAAVNLAAENIGGEDDAGSMALADAAAIIKKYMQGPPPKKGISNHDLVTYLVAMDDRPWKEWKRGSPLNEHSLKRLLKPFNLRPKRIRIGAVLIRGYVTAQVLEAAARYVKEESEEVVEEDEDDGSVPTM